MTGISPPPAATPVLAGLPIIPTPPVYGIVDTDLTNDCDDVGALAIACALQKLGLATISAVICTNKANYSPPCAWQILRYCLGPNNIPVAQYNGPFNFSAAFANGPYCQTLAQGPWGASPATAPASYPGHIATARQAMANWLASGIVGVYITIGTLTSLAEILASPADGISPLTGAQLMAATVSRVVTMGGNDINNSGAAAEFNIAQDGPSAARVQALLPASIEHFFSAVQLGNAVNTVPAVNASSPISQAYTLRVGSGTTRPSWDPSAVFHALLGDRGIMISGARRVTNTIAPGSGVNSWSAVPGPDSCLMLNGASGETAAAFATMMNGLYALAEPTYTEGPANASNVFTGMAGLQWWLAPSDPSSVLQNGAGTVIKVLDLSPSGIHAIPSPDGGVTPPTYAANSINGLGALSFNASTKQSLAADALASIFNAPTVPFHFFMLIKAGAVAAEASYFSMLPANPSQHFPSCFTAIQNSSQQWEFARDNNNGAASYTTPSPAQAISTTAWTLLEAKYDPSVGGVGGTNYALVSGGTAASVANSTAYTLNLANARLMSKIPASDNNLNYCASGLVAEVAIFNQIVSGSTRSAMIGRVNARYGLSLPTT